MKISDDFFDELCRRAAELYPLKVNSIHWVRILQHFKVKSKPDESPIKSLNRKSGKI